MEAFRTPTPTPYDPKLEVEEGVTSAGQQCANVFYVALTEAARLAGNVEPDAPRDRVLIATVTAESLRTYPIHVRRLSSDYLQPKYGTVSTISFAQEHVITNTSFGDADWFLDLLEGSPPGFAKQFQYGLGLKWEYRFLVDAIAGIPGVTEIVITEGDETRLELPIYFLGIKRYDQLRRALDGIGRRNQREAHDDKRLLAYSNLLTTVDRAQYPVRTKKTRPGAIYELVKIGGERATYSRDDQRAAINLIKADKEKIAKTDVQALLTLKAEIEKVTLDALIEKFDEMLSKKLTETDWQQFLKNNPFILSLAFAQPIFVVQDQAYVGGATLRGAGEKIADFLTAQHATGNLALIEIKKPATTLLSPVAYRKDLFSPAKEIGGAISQVLDQRLKLQTNFTQKAYESGLTEVHPYAIQCIVIAGRSPVERAAKKSLELFRNATKDVTVITFDELLQKLKEIQRVFAAGDQKLSEKESPF